MNRYLESLYKYKSICLNPKERLLLKKIALYINGDISTTKLIENLSEKNIEFVVMVLNNVVNDARKFNSYYIELPKNLDFNVKYPYALYAGDTYRFGFIHNTLKFCGPLSIVENKEKYPAKHFAKLTGSFYFPHGTTLNRNDWLKIISKYPNLDAYLYSISCHKYSFEEMQNYIHKYLDDNINCHLENFLDDNIASIKYLEDKRYFDVYSVMDGKISTFKDVILSRQK